MYNVPKSGYRNTPDRLVNSNILKHQSAVIKVCYYGIYYSLNSL